MQLVVAEKPSVARELARVLGCGVKEQGYFRAAGAKGGHLVTYAIGHLVRLANPDEMDPAWGKPWRRAALPMLPGSGAEAWRLIAEDSTRDQFNVIARLLGDKRVTRIINATDAGREGEAIFRRIYALAGASKPVLRFWTSSLTEDAIEQAFTRLRPAADYNGLAAAAATRAQLDWLIGMNHTRAATLHNGQLCSIGRVQTPTLAIIVRRHREIAAWVQTSFYEVHAELASPRGDFIARALTPEQKHDFARKPDAERLLADVPADTPGTITAVDRISRRTPPTQLHNLGELQKEANRRFGLTADRTLECAQNLYEAKAITYPRSSSRYLSDDMAGTFPAILKAIRIPGKEALIAAALARAGKGPRLSKRFVDASKLSDHHAIIPTAKGPSAGASGDERKVYQILTERFVAIFLPDKETAETRIALTVAGHPFRAKGTRLVAPGWTALTGNHDFDSTNSELEDNQPLPPVKAGDPLTVLDSALVTKERKPPARYTDATLLAAMETAGKAIEDDALREAMRGRGLGTEATRAAILKRLLDLGYIARAGKNLKAEPKGIALIAQLEPTLPHLTSPELTGDMEAKLELVEQGKLAAEVILAEVADALRRDIPAVFRAQTIAASAPHFSAPRTPPQHATPEHASPSARSGQTAAVSPGKDVLLCPACRAGKLAQTPGQSFYGCSRFHEGCRFTINTVVAKKALTPGHIRDLTGPGHRTRLIKGFTSKEGRKFDACLVLAEGKVTFEFAR